MRNWITRTSRVMTTRNVHPPIEPGNDESLCDKESLFHLNEKAIKDSGDRD